MGASGIERRRRQSAGVLLAALSGVLLAATFWVWDGRGSRSLTYEQAVGQLRGRNPAAAAQRVRLLVGWGLAELRELEARGGRAGMIAGLALDQLERELKR